MQHIADNSVSIARAPGTSNWRSVLTHTHMLGGELKEPDNRRNLAAWARERRIDALGVGSPFLPATAERYQRFEDAERDRYYAPGFDVQAEKCPAEVAALIRDLNDLSEGHTLFYLDNETPKARYGHLWWIGWWHDFPEWHDYDQPFDRWMCRDQAPGDHGPEPMPYARRPYMEIVATQRARGAMAFWAHPTSWWRTNTGAFVTNIASEMPAHLVADGRIDGLVVMGYDAYRPSYLALWTHLLDQGYEITGVAETDVGLSTMKLWNLDPLFLTQVPASATTSGLDAITAPLRAGCAMVTSGPHIELRVDGAPMGSRLATAADRTHQVEVLVGQGRSSAAPGLLEVLGPKGEVVFSATDPREGLHTFTFPGRNTPCYLWARVFGRNETPSTTPARTVRNLGIANPVYLRPPGWNRPGALDTELTVQVRAGGRFSMEDAAGQLLEEGLGKTGDTIRLRMPASGRIRVTPDNGGRDEIRYLINANPAVQALQRHLYRGQFLMDHPDLPYGDVPAEAFRINEFRKAMEALTIQL